MFAYSILFPRAVVLNLFSSWPFKTEGFLFTCHDPPKMIKHRQNGELRCQMNDWRWKTSIQKNMINYHVIYLFTTHQNHIATPWGVPTPRLRTIVPEVGMTCKVYLFSILVNYVLSLGLIWCSEKQLHYPCRHSSAAVHEREVCCLHNAFLVLQIYLSQ